MTALQELIPIQTMMFFMILTGLVLRKKNIITEEGQTCIIHLLFNLILPCNIVYAFSFADISAVSSLLLMAMVSFSIQLAWYLLSKLLWRKTPVPRQGVLRYAFQFSNCGYLGNPVVESLYGAAGLIYASVFLLPVRIFMWSIGLDCFEKFTGNWKSVAKKLFTHPCVLATLLGFLMIFLPFQYPSVLLNTISGFSKCLTPFILLVVGSIMAKADFKKIICKDMFILSFLRLIAQPFVVMVICKILNIESFAAEIATILVAMPAANATSILATQYNYDIDFASGAVVFTTLLSLITIPLFSLLCSYVF